MSTVENTSRQECLHIHPCPRGFQLEVIKLKKSPSKKNVRLCRTTHQRKLGICQSWGILPYSIHEVFKVVQCCDVVVMHFKLNIRINIPYGGNNRSQ